MSTKPSLGNLVRIVPFHLSDLPPHPSIPRPDPQPDSTTPPSSPTPNLRTFLLTILDEASTFLSPPTFSSTFTPLSTKSSPPSSTDVELYKREIPTSELSGINWSANQTVPRKTPAKVEGENWFARRSVHRNEASQNGGGTAGWEEFVFGLKEQHSKHEMDFTPTLYDAHYVLDWNEGIKKLGKLGVESEESGARYSDVTMEIFEMAHSLPIPLSPRCFPVLVLTATTAPTSFLAVTVPIDLSSPSPLNDTAYYSTGRNTTDPAATEQQRKKPVLGIYAAVEKVRILQAGELVVAAGKQVEVNAEQDGKIEWIMATASDTKGNLPMFLQKPNLPGAVKKDVGLFLDWIRTVDVQAERRAAKKEKGNGEEEVEEEEEMR